MKNMNFRMLQIMGISLTGLFFSTQVPAAGCFDPGEPDTFVTQYGGADLACPSAAFTECIITFKNGAVQTDGCATIDAVIDPDTGGVTWFTENPDEDDGQDAVLTDSAQGGKGCLYSFGTDKFEGMVGYATSPTDFFPPTKAVFCSDGFDEVAAIVQPPAVVEECVIDSLESKLIHGVTFSCPFVPDGETRTVIVSKDTMCTENPDMPGELLCTPVPGFGFTTEGSLDFNNVCQCVGSAVPGIPPSPTTSILQEECDPDPANPEGCEVNNAEVPVEILIQNPTCFTVGGFRRCF